MKKIAFILLALTLFSGVFLTSFGKGQKTIKGYIVSYGSDPLTYPGITTVRNKKYLVIATDETKKELLARQGRLIKFTGTVVKDKNMPFALENGAFRITTWETIDNNK